MNRTLPLPEIPRPRRTTILWGLVLVNVQALFVVTYVAIVDRPLLDPFLVYPWIWINVGIWALVRTEPPDADERAQWIARAVAVGYFGLLAALGGMIALGERFGGNPATGFGARVFEVPLGWGPALLYNGEFVHVSIVPMYFVGFLALAYLVYATALEAGSIAGAGLAGVFSCVTCTLPILAALGTGVVGGSVTAVLDATSPFVYSLGTAIYVGTVVLLYWRPGLK